MTTITMAWGDFSAYEDIQQSNSALASVLFISLLFFVSLILLVTIATLFIITYLEFGSSYLE